MEVFFRTPLDSPNPETPAQVRKCAAAPSVRLEEQKSLTIVSRGMGKEFVLAFVDEV